MKLQRYIHTLLTFLQSEYDIKTKARQLEFLVMDIFDYIQENPDAEHKTGSFLSTYIPTVCRNMDNYRKFEMNTTSTGLSQSIRDTLVETLDLSLTAFGNLLKKICEDADQNAALELDEMKNLMRSEGLI